MNAKEFLFLLRKSKLLLLLSCSDITDIQSQAEKLAWLRRESSPRPLGYTSPMLYQLSYGVKSVRVRGISELSLVSSIPMHVFYDMIVLVLCTQVNIMILMLFWWTSIPKVAVSIPTVVKLTFQPARCGYTLRVTSKTLYSPEYITPKHTQNIIS